MIVQQFWLHKGPDFTSMHAMLVLGNWVSIFTVYAKDSCWMLNLTAFSTFINSQLRFWRRQFGCRRAPSGFRSVHSRNQFWLWQTSIGSSPFPPLSRQIFSFLFCVLQSCLSFHRTKIQRRWNAIFSEYELMSLGYPWEFFRCNSEPFFSVCAASFFVATCDAAKSAPVACKIWKRVSQ